MRIDGAIAEGSEENASRECCFKSTLGPEIRKINARENSGAMLGGCLKAVGLAMELVATYSE